jgi:hypothetical protein
MKQGFRPRISRALNRPDLIYAGIVAMIICVALIARSSLFGLNFDKESGHSVEARFLKFFEIIDPGDLQSEIGD